MNKKRLILIVSLICVLFFMTGCSVKDGAISLDTQFQDVKSEGFLNALLVFPLAQAINWLSVKTGSVFFGIASVALVLNAVVVIATFKSNVSMQRMQELQPEVQKIQLKYEGRTDQASQQRMNAEMQALYKKHGVNPVGSLLSTFIQLPVLFSMYAAVRRSAEVANGKFMGASLSLTPKEAIADKVWILVVIYVIMIIMQFLSTSVPRWIQTSRAKKECEKKHKHYEKPANQNNMMMYSMVVFIGFIMLSWPTALSLYYLVYSFINIAKTFIIDAVMHKDND